MGISSVVANILIQRGIDKEEEILEFLRPSLLSLNSPFAFREMTKAVERLERAHKQGEKVLVYGDYDVDGVTSTALLYKVLKDLRVKAVAYIPSRMDEGYGLHKEAILKASQAEVKVIITVDCGITAVDEVEYAQSLGIDIVLTDHHEPPKNLPRAYAILNPKVADSGYPFRDLAGVGVAFKLAQALLDTFECGEGVYSILEIMDLVALGTIADLVPLVGENRIIVSFGLRQMENTLHLGLGTLLQECGLGGKPLKVGQIAYMVAPRINAAGRMDSARAGLELLITGNEERALELARFLSRENSLRQDTEKEIFAEAVEILEKAPLPRVIVLSAPNWHHGVIGIVASRLVERYYRPVFLISEEEDISKGSARGISGYHVLNELRDQDKLLTKFGGHSQAAGFSLNTEKISSLREALNSSAKKFPSDMFYERIRIDQRVPLEILDASLLRELEELAPFGFGNPTPVLAGESYPLYKADTVGKEKDHLKCSFGSEGSWEGVAFRKGEELKKIKGSPTVDVAFGLEWNTFRGAQNIQMMIKDIKPKATWQEEKQDQLAQAEFAQAQAEIASGGSFRDWEIVDWRSKNREEWNKALASRKDSVITEPTRPKTTASIGGYPRADKSSMDSANFQRGLNPPLKEVSFNVWDCTGTSPRWLHSEQKRSWGMILGIPPSWRAAQEILPQFQAKGVQEIIFAQSEVEESILKERTGYLSREDLVQMYRVLYDFAIKKNSFSFTRQEMPSWQVINSLKIFEELGLLRCLSYSEPKIDIEWIPATKKLDLESALRFRGAKIRWEEAKAFSYEYRTITWKEFQNKLSSPLCCSTAPPD